MTSSNASTSAPTTTILTTSGPTSAPTCNKARRPCRLATSNHGMRTMCPRTTWRCAGRLGWSGGKRWIGSRDPAEIRERWRAGGKDGDESSHYCACQGRSYRRSPHQHDRGSVMARSKLKPPCAGWQRDLPGPNDPPEVAATLREDAPNHIDEI